jgi:peptidoglycan/LPS O-acetylase OafA/YrhL
MMLEVQDMPASSGRRHIGLDAIRGMAISLVVFHHIGLRFPGSVQDPISHFLVSIGWGGVDIFFAISGFLITKILLNVHTSEQLAGFFRKRFFRIVPLYFVALILFIIVSFITGNDFDVLHRIWLNFLLLTSWAIPVFGDDGVPYTITWSVSVEEFAYLLFGSLAMLGAQRFKSSLLFIVTLAICVRAAMVGLTETMPELIYYFAPARIDGIAIGGIVAVFPVLTKRLSGMHWIMPFGLCITVLGVISFFGRHNPYAAIFGYSCIGVTAAWLVSNVAGSNPSHYALPARALSSIGLVSYFCYLFHVFTIGAVSFAGPYLHIEKWSIYAIFSLVMLLTYIPARISWIYFEVPMIAYGRRSAQAIN